MGEHKLFRTGHFRWMIAFSLLMSAVLSILITNFGHATSGFNNMGSVANRPNVDVQGIPFDAGEGSTTDFLHRKITYSRYQEKKELVEVGEGDNVEEVEVTVINPVDGKPEIETVDFETDAWKYIKQRFENGVCPSSGTNNTVLDLERKRCIANLKPSGAGEPSGMEGFSEPVRVDNVSEVASCSSLSGMPYNGLITGINPGNNPTDAQNIAMLYNTWYLQSLIRCASELRSSTTTINLPEGEIYFVGGNQYQPHMKEVTTMVGNITEAYINGSTPSNNAQIAAPLSDDVYVKYCKIASLGYVNYQYIEIENLDELMEKEPYLESAKSCEEQVEQFRTYYNNLTSAGNTGVQSELYQKIYKEIYNIVVNKVAKERSVIKLYDRIDLTGTSLDTVLKPYNQSGNNELDMFLYDNLSASAIRAQISNGNICLWGNDGYPACINPSSNASLTSGRDVSLNIFKIKVQREEKEEEEESGEGGSESEGSGGEGSEGGESGSGSEGTGEEEEEIFNPLDPTKVTNNSGQPLEIGVNILSNGELIGAPQYRYIQNFSYPGTNVNTEPVSVSFGQSLQNASFSSLKVDGKDALGNGNRVGDRAVGTGFTVNLFENVKWNNVTVQNMDATGFALSSPMGEDNEITNSRAFGNGKNSANANASNVDGILENGNGAGFGIDIGYNTYRTYNDGDMLASNLSQQGYRCAIYSTYVAGACTVAIKDAEKHSLTINSSAAIGNATFGFLFQNKNRFQPYKYYGVEGDYAVTNSLAASNAINYGGIRANNVSFSNDVSLTSLNELSSLNVGGNTWGANVLAEALPAGSNDNGSYKHSNGTVTSTRRNTYFSNDSTELGLSSADGKSGIKVLDTAFQDNSNSQTWYYDAITWAEEKGIIGGDNLGSNNFGLKQSITLSQALQLFWRMEGFEDEVISATNHNLSGKAPVLYYGDENNVQIQRFDSSFCPSYYFNGYQNVCSVSEPVSGDLGTSMETRAILWGWANKMFTPVYEVYYDGNNNSYDKSSTLWTNSYVRVGKEKALKRGDFLQILYLFNKGDDISLEYNGPNWQDYVGFSDLTDDTNTYYAAVRWANQNYITDGAYEVSPTNLIKYEENCTMEQALAFLYRYWTNFVDTTNSDSAELENLLDVCHNIDLGSADRDSCEERRKATCEGLCEDMFVLTPSDNE